MKAKCSKIVLAFAFALIVTALLGTVSAFAADRSGTITASDLEANEAITLTDNTVLVMDKDVTVKSIKGAYKLTVQGGKKLTVQSESGIDVNKLVVDGAKVKADKVPADTQKKNNAAVETKQSKAGEQPAPAPVAKEDQDVEGDADLDADADDQDADQDADTEDGTDDQDADQDADVEGDADDQDADVDADVEGEDDPDLGAQEDGDQGIADDEGTEGESDDPDAEGDDQVDGTETDDPNMDSQEDGTTSGDATANDNALGTGDESNSDGTDDQSGADGSDLSAQEEDNGDESGLDTQSENPPSENTKATITFASSNNVTANLPDPIKVTKGEKITVTVSDPTANGYDFGGWFTDAACTKKFDIATATVDGNLTLYAKWTAKAPQYTVTFDVNGFGTAPDAQKIDAGKTATEPTAPTADGVKFDGWYTDKECTKAFDFSTTVTKDTTLYAKWVCTVTFNMNGHGTAPTAQTVIAGKTATQPTAPTADGVKFDGWCTDADCTKAFDFSTAVTKDTTLYAKWVCTVTFDTNGLGTAPAKQTVIAGKTATQPTAPTVKGVKLAGWYTDKECTKAFNFSTAVTKDITLYAKWVCTVKFDKNGHGTAPNDQDVVYGATAKNPGTIAEVIENNVGYEFGGWFTDKNCTAQYNFNTPVKAHTTLYAKWIKVEYKFANGTTPLTWTKPATTTTSTTTNTTSNTNNTNTNNTTNTNNNNTNTTNTNNNTSTTNTTNTTRATSSNTGSNLTFTVNRNVLNENTYKHFTNQTKLGTVLIDNRVVAATNYTAASGSLKVTLKNTYLNTLSVGNHTVKVTFDDGETNPTTTLTIKAAPANQQNNGKGNTPSTGDTLPFVIFGIIAVVALAIVIVALVARKRTRRQ